MQVKWFYEIPSHNRTYLPLRTYDDSSENVASRLGEVVFALPRNACCVRSGRTRRFQRVQYVFESDLASRWRCSIFRRIGHCFGSHWPQQWGGRTWPLRMQQATGIAVVFGFWSSLYLLDVFLKVRKCVVEKENMLYVEKMHPGMVAGNICFLLRSWTRAPYIAF